MYYKCITVYSSRVHNITVLNSSDYKPQKSGHRRVEIDPGNVNLRRMWIKMQVVRDYFFFFLQSSTINSIHLFDFYTGPYKLYRIRFTYFMAPPRSSLLHGILFVQAIYLHFLSSTDIPDGSNDGFFRTRIFQECCKLRITLSAH